MKILTEVANSNRFDRREKLLIVDHKFDFVFVVWCRFE